MGMIMYGHPYIYKLNSADKETQFFKKEVAVKATILDIRTCSTGLLLWRNQKGLTRYLMILYKRDSTADIFLLVFKFFSDKLFHKTVPNY